jgi:CRISPR-associated protein (TIGR03986 family)
MASRLIPEAEQSQQQHNHQGNQVANVQGAPATAPYNFVPINDRVLLLGKNEIFRHHNKYHSDLLNGQINLTITNKTPLYIRRTMTYIEAKECESIERSFNGDVLKDKLREFQRKLFKHYAPGNGIYKIPGSSIRGMIRNLVTIASYSKMSFIADKHLFYRAFMDSSTDLVEEYRKAMLGGDQSSGYYPLSKAGYLFEQNHKWYIQPATEICRVEEGNVIDAGVYDESQSMSIPGDNDNLVANTAYKNMIRGFKCVDVWYINTPEDTHPHHDGTLLKYAEVTEIRVPNLEPMPAEFKRGKLILTEWVNNQRIGKHMHWVIGIEDSSKHAISVSHIHTQYRDDITRAKHIDLFKKGQSGRTPCFYAEVSGEVVAIGHTGMFRMIYDQPISGCIPSEHQDNRIDFTENLFGYVEGAASAPGRVFFEDTDMISSTGTLEPGCPRILSNPKPTSFQLYLDQPGPLRINPTNQKKTGLNNYNSPNARIRGFKLYWHRDASQWKDPNASIENPSKQHTIIQPLKEGCCFAGKIRFENLTKEELGALLFVLDLPQGCLHKIGMAKPLGLGSVQIQAELHLSNRSDRYRSFGCELINPSEVIEHEEYINAFAEMLKLKLGLNMQTTDKDGLWKTDRLCILRKMLDYNHRPDNLKTEYLGHPKIFKPRNILETPSVLVRQ